MKSDLAANLFSIVNFMKASFNSSAKLQYFFKLYSSLQKKCYFKDKRMMSKMDEDPKCTDF